MSRYNYSTAGSESAYNNVSLSEVNEAIRKILVSGQSVKIGSSEVTRADLNKLYAMKKELESASAGSGILGRVGAAVFNGR
ncbi:MAG: peptidylprolyl isomerase [Oscillospiraceae bacterium]|nr:peptidylprolyl isomerase [Oscillospiraceae bacterium]